MNMNIIDYIYPLTTSEQETVSSQTKGWESVTHAINDLQSETLTIRFNAPTPVNHLSFTVKGCTHGTLQITGITEDNMSIPLATNLANSMMTMITPTLTTYTYTITSLTPIQGLLFTFTPLKADAAYTWIVENLMISSTLTDTHPLDYEGLQTVDSQQNINTLHVTSTAPGNSTKAYWISSLTDTSTRSQFLTLPLPSYPVSGVTLNPLYEGQQLNVYYNQNTVHQLTWDYSPHQNMYSLEDVTSVENGSLTGLVGAATFTIPPLSQLPLTLTMRVLLTSTYPTCTLTFNGTPYTLTITSENISVEDTFNNTQITVLEFPQSLAVDAYNHLLDMSLTITADMIILTATASKLTSQGTIISTDDLGTSSQQIPSAITILGQETTVTDTPITLPETEETLYLQLTRPEPYHTLGTINTQTITNPLTLIGDDNNSIGYDSEDINPFNSAASSHLITTPTTITFTCPNNSLFYTLTTHIKGSLPTSSNTVFLITDTTTGDTLPLQCEAMNSLETDDQWWTEYATTFRFPEKYYEHQLTLTITPLTPLTLSMLRLWNTTAPQQLIPLDTSNGTSFNPTVSIPLQLLTMSSTPQLTSFTTHLFQAESLTLTNGILNSLTLTTGNTPLLTYTSTQSVSKYTTCGLIPSPRTSWEPLVLNRTLNSQSTGFPYVCHGGTLLLEFTQLTPISLSMDMMLHTLQNLDYQPPEKNENSTTAATLTEAEKTYYQNPSNITNPLITISNTQQTTHAIPGIPPHHIQQRSETVSRMTSIHELPHVNENTDYQIVNGQTLDHTVLLPGHQQSVSPSDLRMLMNSLTPYTNGKSTHQNASRTLSKQFHLQQFTTRTRNHTAYHTGLLNFTWQPVNTLIDDQLTLTGSMLTIQTPRTLSYMEKTLTHNHTNGILNSLTLTTGKTPLLTYTSTQSVSKYTTCGLIPSPRTSWEPLVLNRTLNSQSTGFPYVCHGGTLLLEFTQLTPISLSMDMMLHTLQNLDYQPPEKNENSTTAATLTEAEKTYYQNPSNITNPLITISNTQQTTHAIPGIPPHHIQQRSETVSRMTSIHELPHVNENTDYQIVNGQTLDHTVLLPGHQQSVSPSDLRMLMNSLTPYTNGKSTHQNASRTLSKQFHLQQFTTRTRNHTAYHTGLLNFTWQPVNTLIDDQLTLTGSMLTIQTPRTLSYMEKTLTHNHTNGNGIATISLTTLHSFRTLNFSNYSGTTGETILLPLHETPVLTQSYWKQHPSLNSVWNDQKVTWESPSIVWGTTSPSLPTSMNFITQNITRAAGKALNCENIQSLQLPSLTITHPVEQITMLLHLQLLTNTLTTPPLLTLTFTNNETVIETTARINPHTLTLTNLQVPPISLSKGTWTIHLSSSVPLSFLLYQAIIHTSSISILLNAQPHSENGVWYNITSSMMHNTNYTLPTPVTSVELQFTLNNGESFTNSTITPAYDTGYTTLPAISTMNHILRISPQPPTSLLINQTLLLQPESLNLNTSMISTINPLACMWESTNPDVLTVNQYGFISGIQPGTAQVRVHWLDNIWESNLITVEE